LFFLQLCTLTVAEPVPFSANSVREFKVDGEPAMRMPTDVAVAPDRRVFVADGVNQRVVVFSADGRVIEILRKVGDQDLSNPTGLAMDGEGRLFICDTGLHKVLVLGKDGQFLQDLITQARADERQPDPTDVAVDAKGTSAWVADNDNDRILRFDLATGTQAIMGRHGESVGELQHPFMVALGSEDDVFVTDVINSRVSVFSKNAAPSQPVGSYGVEPGQLYRPKGIAIDWDNNVWVSDGTLGVVQVFTSEGGFLDVLRDPAGKPLHFESPMGLAFDREKNLYVVELARNSVRGERHRRTSTISICRKPIAR
jgi:DNA-binding beta-propeller fold protein YncE